MALKVELSKIKVKIFYYFVGTDVAIDFPATTQKQRKWFLDIKRLSPFAITETIAVQ